MPAAFHSSCPEVVQLDDFHTAWREPTGIIIREAVGAGFCRAHRAAMAKKMKAGDMTEPIPIFGSEEQIPDSVAGLGLEGIERYPDPRLGVMVRYGIPPWVKADAYLYDMGMPGIPDELESPQVIGLFEESLRSVVMAAEQGMYRDFEILRSGYINVPPEASTPLCLCASFAYSQNAGAPIPADFQDRNPVIDDVGRLISHLALRTDRGYINKIRFNYPEDAGDGGFAGFLNFLVEWTNLVQTASPTGLN